MAPDLNRVKTFVHGCAVNNLRGDTGVCASPFELLVS